MILFPSLESDGGEFLTLVSQVSRLAELVWRGEWGAGPRVTALPGCCRAFSRGRSLEAVST